MAVLYRGDEQREARSPYVINSLKAQGYTDKPKTRIAVTGGDDAPKKVKVKKRKERRKKS